MNLKTVVPLSAATVLGLVAAIVAAQLVRQRPVLIVEGDQTRALSMTEVVVAGKDIAPGTVLKLEDLATARFESGSAPPEAPRSMATLVNRVAKVQVPRGQVFHPTMLAEQGVAGGLSAVIPDGMRAMTVEVNEFTGLAGLIEPGNRVDVIARVRDGSDDKNETVRTIVQDVQVLAIGNVLTNSKALSENNGQNAAQKAEAESTLPASKQPGARSATLLLSPEDVERLDLAMGQNPTMSIRFALRSPVDRKPAGTAGATMASLMTSGGGGGVPATDPTGGDARLASAKSGPTTRAADDVFGVTSGPVRPAPSGKAGMRSITVIRAGVPTQVEVEDTMADHAE